MSDKELSQIVLNCAFRVHSALGPGLLESSYQKCLAYELREANLKVEEEKLLPLVYKRVEIDCAYRIDLWIEDRLLVELKTVKSFELIHLAQTITYLKLSKTRFGLLLNFNVARLKDGIKRVVND